MFPPISFQLLWKDMDTKLSPKSTCLKTQDVTLNFHPLHQGRQTFFHDKWNSFNLVLHVLYGISFVVWVSTTIHARNFYIYAWMEQHPGINETVRNNWTAVMKMFNDEFQYRYSLESGDPVLVSEAFFSLATIMAFLRVLQV